MNHGETPDRSRQLLRTPLNTGLMSYLTGLSRSFGAAVFLTLASASCGSTAYEPNGRIVRLDAGNQSEDGNGVDAHMGDAAVFDGNARADGGVDGAVDAGGFDDAGQKQDGGQKEDAGEPVDAGETRDAGEEGRDAGDAGSQPDAGQMADAGNEQDAGGTVDAGEMPDAGDAGLKLDAGPDAGQVADAGEQHDAGLTSDAGSVQDAGEPIDAGPADAGVDAGSDAGVDAGQPPVCPDEICLVGVGACETPGHVTCDADGAVTGCEPDTPPPEPQPEECDKIDNDCDARTDIDPATGRPLSQVCNGCGTQVCESSGTWSVCVGPDRDGDGRFDCQDGCPDTPDDGQDANWNGTPDACDAFMDNLSCTNTASAPRPAVGMSPDRPGRILITFAQGCGNIVFDPGTGDPATFAHNIGTNPQRAESRPLVYGTAPSGSVTRTCGGQTDWDSARVQTNGSCVEFTPP